MFNSKKFAVTAGALCSLALMGVGAGQAFGHAGSSTCGEDKKGHTRCVQEAEYHFTSDEYGNVRLVNKQHQECSGGPCENRLVLGDETKS